MRHLKELDLSKCGLKFRDENIGECKQLEELTLDDNKLLVIPLSLGKCKHLETISAEGYFSSLMVFLSIPRLS